MVLGAEMYGFDSDEERLEYLSSLMDSEDTSQQQQAQGSGDRGTCALGTSSRTLHTCCTAL